MEQLAGKVQSICSAQWMRVHEHLQFKKNVKNLKFIPLEAYNRITEIHGVTDRSERKKMTQFLRGIGTLDYFIDHDSDLRDTVILDSGFLSRELSGFIQHGSFYGKDSALLDQVLHIAEQLAVIHIRKNGSVLVPNTLPATKPTISNFWKDSSTPNLFEHGRRLTFGFLPDGLFPRIIARILSTEKMELISSWRYGVIIRSKTQFAMITHTPVYQGKLIHEIKIRCQLSENVLYKQSSDESEILNPHELLLYSIITLIQNFITCYFPFLFEFTNQWVPCYYCIKEEREQPHYIHVNELEKAIQLGKQFVFCEYSHFRSNSTPPLWIPLLVPDKTMFIEDSVWNETKPWSIGIPKTIPEVKILEPQTYEHHNHPLGHKYSSCTYNLQNEFTSLSGNTAHKKNNIVTSLLALSDTVLWVGYDNGVIGIHQITKVENQLLMTCKTRWRAHFSAVIAIVAVSIPEKGTFIWSSSEDGTLRVWDTSTTFQQRSISERFEIENMVVVGNGSIHVRIISSSRDEPGIRIWNPIDYSCKRIPFYQDDSTASSVSCILIHGEYILAGKGNWVYLLSIVDFKIIAIWKAYEKENVAGLHSLGGTNMLLSWSTNSNIISMWYLAPNSEELIFEGCELHGHTSQIVTCCTMKLKNDQLILWSSSINGEMILWDACKLETLFVLDFKGDSEGKSGKYATHITSLKDTILVTSGFCPSINVCLSLFYQPTPFLNHRVSIDYLKLYNLIKENPTELFTKFVAPG